MRKISTIIGLAIATILTAYISALTLSNQAFAQPDKPGQTIGNNFFSQQPNGGPSSNNQAQPEGQHAGLGGAGGAAGLFGQTPAGPEDNRYAHFGQVGPSPGVHDNAAITSPTHVPIAKIQASIVTVDGNYYTERVQELLLYTKNIIAAELAQLGILHVLP
jgi:hypothetical protein